MANERVFVSQYFSSEESFDINVVPLNSNPGIASQFLVPSALASNMPVLPNNALSSIDSQDLYRFQQLNAMNNSANFQTKTEITQSHFFPTASSLRNDHTHPPASRYNTSLRGKINSPQDIHLYGEDLIFRYIKELEADDEVFHPRTAVTRSLNAVPFPRKLRRGSSRKTPVTTTSQSESSNKRGRPRKVLWSTAIELQQSPNSARRIGSVDGATSNGVGPVNGEMSDETLAGLG